NVFLCRDGATKVLDLGIARMRGALEGPGDGGERSTSGETSGPHSGTPEYMAPELWHGHDADESTDVYSAGVTLFEALTGELPFAAGTTAPSTGESSSDAPAQAGERPLPAERLYEIGLPEPLAELVLRATARKRSERWPDAEAFLATLLRVQSGPQPE